MFPTLTAKFFEDAKVKTIEEFTKTYYGKETWPASMAETPYTCSIREFHGISKIEVMFAMMAVVTHETLCGGIMYNTTQHELAEQLKSHGWTVTSYRGNHGHDVHVCVLAKKKPDEPIVNEVPITTIKEGAPQ